MVNAAWFRLYRILGAPLIAAASRILALGSPKARRMLAGRRDWRRQLEGLARRRTGVPRIHVHAASVGEFEQAKPLIEELRRRLDAVVVTATFFSPSGFEQQGRYEGLDAACYLPEDRPSEMHALFDCIDPDLVLIVRYDLWPAFVAAAGERRIPIVLVCGVLRDTSRRLAPVLRWFFRRLYGMLSLIHAVGEEDRAAFARLAPDVHVVVSGDTRYDRVAARASVATPAGAFSDEWIAGRTVLVAGSTWPADEDLLVALADRPDLLLVIVPHEPTPEHVRALLRRFAGSSTLSSVEQEEPGSDVRAVIVDRTGVLATLYRVGAIAYVGGGFGAGVHSVLEPASHGVPVFAGPHIERSRDAVLMNRVGVLRLVTDVPSLVQSVDALVGDEAERVRRGEAARAFVAKRTGATGSIVESLMQSGYLQASQHSSGRHD